MKIYKSESFYFRYREKSSSFNVVWSRRAKRRV